MVREDEGRDEIAATEQADACDNKMNQSYISQTTTPRKAIAVRLNASMMAPSIQWLTAMEFASRVKPSWHDMNKNRENYRTSFRQAQVLPQKVVSWGRKTMT